VKFYYLKSLINLLLLQNFWEFHFENRAIIEFFPFWKIKNSLFFWFSVKRYSINGNKCGLFTDKVRKNNEK
jgi:hypothetical protein